MSNVVSSRLRQLWGAPGRMVTRRAGTRVLGGLSAIIAALGLAMPNAGVAYATGLTAVAVSNSQINLNWTAVPDGGPVYIRRCQGVGCDIYNAPAVVTNLANPGSYQDVGLMPGTTYGYIVVGSNGYYSTYATTGFGLAARVAGPNEIDLAWSHVPDAGPVYVRRCVGANCFIYDAPAIAWNLANPGTYTDYAVTAGNTYRYLVVGSNGFFGASAAIPAPPDRVPPVTTASASPAPVADGWNNSDVVVTLGSTDSETNGSGVRQVTYSATGAQAISSTTVPGSSATVRLSADGITTLSYYGTDNAGNVEAARSLVVKIDKTAPTIAINTPANNGAYVLGQAVQAAYSCSDGGSGVATCSGSVANGAAVDTSSVGAKTLAVSSSDKVGNAATRTAGYSVSYAICPVRDEDEGGDVDSGHHASTGPPVYEAGSEVHIRIALCDASGANVSSHGIVVTATSLSPGVLRMNSDGHSKSHASYAFTFDEGTYGYQFKSKGLAAGTYTLSFRAGNDPVTHTVQFVLRGNHGHDRD